MARNLSIGTAAVGTGGIAGLVAQLQSSAHAQTTTADGRTRLILLGTQGGPNFNPTRGEQANLLIVDGSLYMIDCGYGAMMSVRKAGHDHLNIGQIFLTHLHDDHTSDLAALLSHQWTDGRIEPTVVHGPYGTEAMVNAALEFSRASAEIRLADEDRGFQPSELISGRDLVARMQTFAVYEDELVRVSAIENTHFPEESKELFPYRALSYRFDAADRSVVFSGDTGYSEALIELATGADVLVCETIEVAAMRRGYEGMLARGMYEDNPEGVWNHIVGTHVSTEDAGRMAAAAGVGTLVFSHILPGALAELDDAAYIEGVRRHFDGEVIVGQDLMVI
jgi:ribonuclease BN (tRNA processing enzyme)